jgi:hypothetical protein
MSGLFPTASWAVRLSFLGAAALGIVQPAVADRPLQLTFKESPTHARITAKWADGDENAPKISAQVSNQVLILSFDQKVTIDFTKLKEGLPSWAAVTFMDPDGMTARIGLKQTPRLAVSTSIDLVALDLIPESVTQTPPKIVSPLVAKRAAEAEARARRRPPGACRARAAGSARQPFGRQLAHRLLLGFKNRLQGRTSQGEGTLTLQFAKRAKPDLAYLRITPPPNLADFKGENSDRGYVVTITSKDKLPIKHYPRRRCADRRHLQAGAARDSGRACTGPDCGSQARAAAARKCANSADAAQAGRQQCARSRRCPCRHVRAGRAGARQR